MTIHNDIANRNILVSRAYIALSLIMGGAFAIIAFIGGVSLVPSSGALSASVLVLGFTPFGYAVLKNFQSDAIRDAARDAIYDLD